MSRRTLAISIVISAAGVLLVSAAALFRDYQDGWILEGLTIPFILFIIAYSAFFFLEENEVWLVILATISRCTLTLIPALKYAWFMGSSVDQHIQYSLAEYVRVQGRLISLEQLRTETLRIYTSTPGMPLSFANLSIVSGMPLSMSFKFLPLIITALYPPLTYIVIKNLGLPKNMKVLKYALYFSSLLFDPALSYIVSGTMFGVTFLFLILVQAIGILRANNSTRGYTVLFFLFTIALTTTHNFTAIMFVALMVGILFLSKLSFLRARIKPLSSREVALWVMFVNVAWLTLQAGPALNFMTKQITALGILGGSSVQTGHIPVRFFELFRLSSLESVKTVLANVGVDLFFLLITIIGVLLVAKSYSSDTLRVFWAINLLLILSIFGGIAIGIGAFYWNRLVRFTSISCGMFFGIIVARVKNKKLLSFLAVPLLVAVSVITPLEFGLQPIVSPASIISLNLPSNEPILYIGQVNSIYQRKLVSFAETYIKGAIATDEVTRSQIIGLTSISFSQTHIAWVYPLNPNESNSSKVYYKYFLTHLPGKSGSFHEQAETRNMKLILTTLSSLKYDVLYSNAESYALQLTPAG